MLIKNPATFLSTKFSFTVAPHEQQNTFRILLPPARKVSPLRQRMIDDMTVRNLAPNTMLCYLKQVNYLTRTPEEIREYQLCLAQDRKVSVSSRLVATTALFTGNFQHADGGRCFRERAERGIRRSGHAHPPFPQRDAWSHDPGFRSIRHVSGGRSNGGRFRRDNGKRLADAAALTP